VEKEKEKPESKSVMLMRQVEEVLTLRLKSQQKEKYHDQIKEMEKEIKKREKEIDHKYVSLKKEKLE
jgi:hypothetical protein